MIRELIEGTIYCILKLLYLIQKLVSNIHIEVFSSDQCLLFHKCASLIIPTYIGTAAPLQLMFVEALLLNTFIASFEIATQRTRSRGKNSPRRKACLVLANPSWLVIPVATKELAISGTTFSIYRDFSYF